MRSLFMLLYVKRLVRVVYLKTIHRLLLLLVLQLAEIPFPPLGQYLPEPGLVIIIIHLGIWVTSTAGQQAAVHRGRPEHAP